MALSKDRNTKSREGLQFRDPVAAGAKIFAGALVVINATGFAAPGSTATGLRARGVAQEQVDNTGGADGALDVDTRRGCFPFDNSAAADEITRADIGNQAYIVNDHTVAKTSATNTRSVAGIIRDVTVDGVWVEI
ncbi:hypothetical protein D9M68_380710 [compost metagenome]